MSWVVVWAPSAKEEFADLLGYIEAYYGTDAALIVMDKVEETVEIIRLFPNAYPSSRQQPGIRKAVITKQTSLFYRVLETQIQLLHLWDNRQNPERIEDLFDNEG